MTTAAQVHRAVDDALSALACPEQYRVGVARRVVADLGLPPLELAEPSEPSVADALAAELLAAGVPSRTREAVVADVRRATETADEAIARLRAEGTLPSPPAEEAPDADAVAAIEARLPTDLDDADRAEVVRIALEARADR